MNGIEGWYWAVRWDSDSTFDDGAVYPSIIFVVRDGGGLRVLRGSPPYGPLREWRLLKPIPFQTRRVSNDGMVPP